MFEQINALVKHFEILRTSSLAVIDVSSYKLRLEAIQLPGQLTSEVSKVKADLAGLRAESEQLKSQLKWAESVNETEEKRLQDLKADIARLVMQRQDQVNGHNEEYREVDFRLQKSMLACVQARSKLQELKLKQIQRRRNCIN